MRAVVQRVEHASVLVDGETVAVIASGLLVLLGVGQDDDAARADRMADKVLAVRIFEDDDGKMNRSVRDVDGEVLCVSNFTVYGDTRRGNRPSFVQAAPPERAEALYKRVRDRLGAQGGEFGAHMEVELVNDGPVTLVVEL
jgi:D-tyrosyl-tRNA(Tyr) deacylase